MKDRFSVVFNTAIECIHFTLIAFALSAMAFVFKGHPLFILFFASEIALLVVCFGLHLLMAYFIGLPTGPIVPFSN